MLDGWRYRAQRQAREAAGHILRRELLDGA
jgi:hypothetical protein